MRGIDQEDAALRLWQPTLMPGEQLLWRGKPQRRAFVADNCLKMMPIAVIWFCIDFQFVKMAVTSNQIFLLLFLAFHLFPVWIWLYSALTAGKRWNNIHYVLTNQRLIIRSGFLSVSENSIYLHRLMDVTVKTGILDKPFGTGSVVFNVGNTDYRRSRSMPPAFEHLENADRVYHRIQQAMAMGSGERTVQYSFDSL